MIQKFEVVGLDAEYVHTAMMYILYLSYVLLL